MLCLSDTIHNFKCVKIIQILKNGGQHFEIMLDNVTCYLNHAQKLVFNMLITMKKNEYNRKLRLKENT